LHCGKEIRNHKGVDFVVNLTYVDRRWEGKKLGNEKAGNI
jgi:hypothetical protein